MDFTTDQIVSLIGLVAGVVGMPVIGAIKKMLGANGKYALAVASVLSVMLAAVVVALSGAFAGAVFDLDTMIKASAEVFAVATIMYKALQADKPVVK
jgi:hypothetical protein